MSAILSSAIKHSAALFLAGGLAAIATPASACNTEPYIGTICTFAFDWCPAGYVPADGRSLTIQQNQALFGLIGFLYGGDQRTSFNIPDLRGRIPVGQGQGQGLANINIAQQFGQQQLTLNTSQTPVPAHAHPATFVGTGGGGTQQVTVPAVPSTLGVTINASAAPTGTVKAPGGNMLASVGGPGALVYTPPNTPSGTGTVALAPAAVTVTGTAGTPQIQFDVPVGGITGGDVTVNQNTPVAASNPVSTQPPSLGMSVCIAVQGLYPNRP
jgi:microcystin-dependent protein